MPIAFLLILLGVVVQPPTNVSGGPKVTASFSYANVQEICASLLHVNYSYTNAPADLVWTMEVQTVYSKLPYYPQPGRFRDDGTGPLNKTTTVAIPTNSPTDQARGSLSKTYQLGGGITTKAKIVSLASVQVTRPCRSHLQMQVLPH